MAPSRRRTRPRQRSRWQARPAWRACTPHGRTTTKLKASARPPRTCARLPLFSLYFAVCVRRRVATASAAVSRLLLPRRGGARQRALQRAPIRLPRGGRGRREARVQVQHHLAARRGRGRGREQAGGPHLPPRVVASQPRLESWPALIESWLRVVASLDAGGARARVRDGRVGRVGGRKRTHVTDTCDGHM